MSLRDKLGVVSYHGIEVLSRLVDAGFKHFRLSDAAWHICEPKQGEYRFEHMDAAIDFLKQNGCAPLLSLYGIPCWTDPENKYPRIGNISATECAVPYMTDEHRPYWKQYLHTIVKRYGDYVKRWGITCEINLPTAWWSGTEEEFAYRIMLPAFEAIRVENNGLLIAPGITIQGETNSNFTRAVKSMQEFRKYARGMMDHLDIHVYRDKNPEKLIPDIIRFFKTFKKYTNNKALLRKQSEYYTNETYDRWPRNPIYITEIGFDMRGTGKFPAGEEGHKQKIAQLIDFLNLPVPEVWTRESPEIYSSWIKCAYIYRAWSPKPDSGALLRPDYSPTATLKYVSELLT